MTGMTTASMIAVASYRMVSSDFPIGPCGAKTPSLHEARKRVGVVTAMHRLTDLVPTTRTARSPSRFGMCIEWHERHSDGSSSPAMQGRLSYRSSLALAEYG